MLITKEVEVGLVGKNIDWYEDRGYEILRRSKNKGDKPTVPKNTKIIVKVEDLTNASRVKVDVACDCCGKILNLYWYTYTRSTHKDNKYYCQKCSSKLFVFEKSQATKLDNSISFYDWCYKNLSKEDADKILSRWDYDLNKLSPKEVSYCSVNTDGRGYWFKCSNNKNHTSEQRNIASFVQRIDKGNNATIDCIQCNTVFETHPHLIKYFVYEQDAKTYAAFSNKKALIKCPDCGYEKHMLIYEVTNKGFSCKKCGDGVSYPEKIVFNVLEQLEINFYTQSSKKDLSWCGNYRYDFYFEYNNKSYLIEANGGQHYFCAFESMGGKSLEETQENDRVKQELALSNGINHYIVLDCRKSELELIKLNILNSELPKLLNFKEEDIDWLKCHEFALSSRVKEACDLYKTNTKKVLEIANTLKLSITTIKRYLKIGEGMGWCVLKLRKNRNIYREKNKKTQVICINTLKFFDSITQASLFYKANLTKIGQCCKDITKSSGRHPETKKKLKWMYTKEYIGICNKELLGFY